MGCFLHKVNPTLKLFILLVSFIGVLFIEDIYVVLCYLVVLFFLFVLSTQLTLRQNLLLLLLLLLLFISTATSMVFFGKGTITWFCWGLIHITEESYYHGMFLGIRTLVFAFLGILFSLTTKPVLLFYSLMQQLGLKPKYAYSFMAGIRLLPMAMEEFQIIKKAIYVRGIKRRWGIGGAIHKLKLYTVPLLAQSIRRAYRIAIAMETKLFLHYANRTFYYKIQFSKFDFLFICLFLGIVFMGFFIL